MIWHCDERERDCKKSAIFGWWFKIILQETGLIQELKNQKSWKLNQTPSYCQQAENNCTEWRYSDFRATVLCFCLFCLFLFKRRSTKNSCAQRRKWGKLWPSQHLCFPLWGLLLPWLYQEHCFCTHTLFSVTWGVESRALGGTEPQFCSALSPCLAPGSLPRRQQGRAALCAGKAGPPQTLLHSE